MTPSPSLSVVIPAHNEEAVIGRCLTAFLPSLGSDAEVVVVANGCTDDTAAVARSVQGVKVIELDEPSKAAALNAGDAAVSAFPRVFLDADIVVDAQTLRALGAALARDEALIGSPRPVFNLEGCSPFVRAFFTAYTALPYVNEGLVGAGIYGVSALGRRRFGDFPDLTADDLFIQRLFAAHERIQLDNHTFEIRAPRTLSALVAVRARTARGSAELSTRGGEFRSSTRQTVVALLKRMIRTPRTIPDGGVYVLVTLAARFKAKRRSAPRWERDHTTRVHID